MTQLSTEQRTGLPPFWSSEGYWKILSDSLESTSKIFLKNTWLHLFVWPMFARVCLSQRMSILRLKVHYGRGLMSSELPKKGSQLLDWCQCTRISSLCVTGAFRSVSCFIDPSLPCPFRYIQYIYISALYCRVTPWNYVFQWVHCVPLQHRDFFFPLTVRPDHGWVEEDEVFHNQVLRCIIFSITKPGNDSLKWE